MNAGSTSLKLEVYDLSRPLPPVSLPPDPQSRIETTMTEAEEALRACLRQGVDTVAHRFVRMPDVAAPVVRLDAGSITAIERAGADAPLHDASALRAVKLVERLAPGVVQVAISDSDFHRTMPEAATTYAIPRALTKTGLRRRGYHGLSHEYALHRACALAHLDASHARVITAHLGGGSSLCAIRSGESIDTTMGYTPLDGLPMATRSGSVDPGLLMHLLRSGMAAGDMDDMLEHRSGLFGISETTGDVRELLLRPDDARATLALAVLAWRIRAALGAMVATLGGCDLIAFTGGIGEHALQVRSAALDGGLGIGATLDAQRNETSVEGRLSRDGTAPAIFVVPAREGWQLARKAIAATIG